MVAHVYVRFDSPLSSAPSTDSVVVVPVTGLGLAEAGVAIVGGLFGTVTVTLAVPFTPPLAAVTVPLPALVPAVNRPLLSIVPAALTPQVKPGCVVRSVANWSRATALNCRVVLMFTVALDGETTMLVRV